MRSTIDISDKLFEEAKRLTHEKTKRRVIEQALIELIRTKRLEQLRGRLGKIPFHLSLKDLEGLRARG